MRHQAGHYYHVYNRGCSREDIFANEGNYVFLLRRVRTHLADSRVSVIAYCLMPNHYHFLLRSEEDGGISRFVQRLFNSYTQAFNKQQGRKGTLVDRAFVRQYFRSAADYERFLKAEIDPSMEQKLRPLYLD
jgi:REP element-mobilizing transposase RayT